MGNPSSRIRVFFCDNRMKNSDSWISLFVSSSFLIKAGSSYHHAVSISSYYKIKMDEDSNNMLNSCISTFPSTYYEARKIDCGILRYK